MNNTYYITDNKLIKDMENKINLFGKTLNELTDICSALKLPKFTAKQITEWLYKKEISNIDEMSNISKKNRELLSKEYDITLTNAIKVEKSSDGTKKYLFSANNNNYIETAMIPDKNRKTVCVSSQVGCKMGCVFCMTGKQGFQSNLTVAEILNQYRSIDEWQEITNIVYMGMGEPFDNLQEVMKSIEILTSEWGYALSPKRITVSSIGIIPSLNHFLQNSNCHLAISLHTPFNDEREKLMPIQKTYGIAEIVNIIKEFDFGLQRKISFEYIMFNGLNDTQAHIDELVNLLKGLRCRINLIRFHPIPNSDLQGTNEQTLRYFKDTLNKKGILTTIRSSRGEDIFAACGLLSTKELLNAKSGNGSNIL
jgi:23S rRNA (adenine2503-C2)-methyltransferase